MIHKYVRGSIWWYKNKQVKAGSHIQSGQRPCVIVSNDKNNKHCPTVNICPMSTKIDSLPIHVDVDLSRPSQILCEQILTVDKSELNEYIGVLDEDTLSKLNAAMTLQLSLNSSTDNDILIQLKSILAMPEQLNTIKAEEFETSMQKYTEMDSAIKDVAVKVNDVNRKYAGMSAVEKFNARYNKQTESSKTTKAVKPVKKTTRRWTLDDKKAMVEDYKTMSQEKLAEKYNLRIGTISNYLSVFRKDIRNAEQNK